MQFYSRDIVATYPSGKVKGRALLLALHYLSVVLKFVSMIIRVVPHVQGLSWDQTPGKLMKLHTIIAT